MKNESVSAPSERLSLSERDQFWDERDWALPLRQYSQTTGMTVSVFDRTLERRFGPLISSPLTTLLESTRFWESPSGGANEAERKVAQQALEKSSKVEWFYEDSLYLAAIPLCWGNHQVGAITFGWVFDHYADPVECARLAKVIGLPSHQFWLTAREQVPIHRERLRVFADLLSSLTQSILNQLGYLEELREASRLKDEFVATVSHELKTPMTSIQLRLQILRRSGGIDAVDKEKVWRTLEIVDRAVQVQARLIEDLLEGSRITTGKFRLVSESVDLVRIAEKAIETVTPLAHAKGVELILDISLHFQPFVGDAVRLEQVFWNLLANAIKFTPQGGKIRFEMRENLDQTTIRVMDTGKGISAEFLPHVFDRFSQSREGLSPSNRGLGLGLAIAQYVVDLHGGKISVESPGLGKGTTFTVDLPRVKEKLDRAHP